MKAHRVLFALVLVCAGIAASTASSPSPAVQLLGLFDEIKKEVAASPNLGLQFLIDASGSINTVDFQRELAMANSLCAKFNNDCAMGLFSDSFDLRSSWTRTLSTNDKRNAGGTNLVPGIKGMQQLAVDHQKEAILLIFTDGDASDLDTAESLLRASTTFKFVVVVGFGNVNENSLQRIAGPDRLKGASFLFGNAAQIESIVNNFVAHVDPIPLVAEVSLEMTPGKAIVVNLQIANKDVNGRVTDDPIFIALQDATGGGFLLGSCLISIPAMQPNTHPYSVRRECQLSAGVTVDRIPCELTLEVSTPRAARNRYQLEYSRLAVPAEVFRYAFDALVPKAPAELYHVGTIEKNILHVGLVGSGKTTSIRVFSDRLYHTDFGVVCGDQNSVSCTTAVTAASVGNSADHAFIDMFGDMLGASAAMWTDAFIDSLLAGCLVGFSRDSTEYPECPRWNRPIIDSVVLFMRLAEPDTDSQIILQRVVEACRRRGIEVYVAFTHLQAVQAATRQELFDYAKKRLQSSGVNVHHSNIFLLPYDQDTNAQKKTDAGAAARENKQSCEVARHYTQMYHKVISKTKTRYIPPCGSSDVGDRHCSNSSACLATPYSALNAALRWSCQHFDWCLCVTDIVMPLVVAIVVIIITTLYLRKRSSVRAAHPQVEPTPELTPNAQPQPESLPQPAPRHHDERPEHFDSINGTQSSTTPAHPVPESATATPPPPYDMHDNDLDVPSNSASVINNSSFIQLADSCTDINPTCKQGEAVWTIESTCDHDRSTPSDDKPPNTPPI